MDIIENFEKIISIMKDERLSEVFYEKAKEHLKNAYTLKRSEEINDLLLRCKVKNELCEIFPPRNFLLGFINLL